MIAVDNLIGIPYKSGGRDKEGGVDCWGLVRLVYEQTFNISLPTLSSTYTDATDGAQAEEALLRNREGWGSVVVPQIGDVILFNIAGRASHVGVYIGSNEFIHAMEGKDVRIERLTSPMWEKRVVGFFKYDANAVENTVELVGCAHPLKTSVTMLTVKAGDTLLEIIRNGGGVPEELLQDGMAWVNDVPVEFSQWDKCIPLAGDRVEFRVVPRGGNPLRAILSIVVMIAAAWVAGPAGVAFAQGLGLGAASGIAAAVAGAVVATAGNLLVNAIAPIRQPHVSNDASAEGKSLLSINTGANRENPFGSIPVVLGKHKFTPPLAASFHTSSLGTDRYLHMLLCWGYGETQVENLRIGDTPITNYENVEYRTVTGGEANYQAQLNYVLDLYGRDTDEHNVGIKPTPADGWITRTTSVGFNATTLDVVFTWPQGLFGIDLKTGGNVDRTTVLDVQYRKVGSGTWYQMGGGVAAKNLNITTPAYRDIGASGHVSTYTYTTIYLGSTGIATSKGDSSDGAPNFTGRFVPKLPPDAIPLYHVCTNGFSIVDKRDVRPSYIVGGAFTQLNILGDVQIGDIVTGNAHSIAVTKRTKDAFEKVLSVNVDAGQYEIRVQRIDNLNQGGNEATDCYWDLYRGMAIGAPVIPPVNMAFTSVKIRATNQLNGNIEGINGYCYSVCESFNKTGDGSSIRASTSNPADLYRYVLQHPANAKAISNSEINLVELDKWASFCATNGLSYNNVHLSAMALTDVLADIAAAGRASPRLADGRWSVVVDEPKSITQHITPHNSWGFEATRVLPNLPHGFRVTFNNEAKEYETDERIVYADGYDVNNATLFEGISFAGVTNSDAVYKLARHHLAQTLLRPEEYVVNMDVEHLIAQRGDRVRVNHDVPMWGLGSARIRSLESSVAFTIDEEWPMDGGVPYTVRMRSQNGSTYTYNLVPAVIDGYYNTFTTTSPIDPTLAANDLCMFGEVGNESVDCIIKAVESTGNLTARITLVDYSPAIFDASTGTIPPFVSAITRPPVLDRFQITQTPVLRSLESGTTALIRETTGRVVATLMVAFSNPAALHPAVTDVEIQIRNPADTAWDEALVVPVKSGMARFVNNIETGLKYDIRARYTSKIDVSGKWVDFASQYTVIGKSEPPSNVTNLTASIDKTGSVLLSWKDIQDLDRDLYEIRRANSDWGNPDVGVVYTSTTTSLIPLEKSAGSYTYYLKARDTSNLYSAAATSVSLNITAPAVPANAQYKVQGNAIVLNWDDSVLGSFNLGYYEIRDNNVVIGTVKGTMYTITEDILVGTHNYTIKAVDVAGNASAFTSPLVVKVLPPAAPAAMRSTLQRTTLVLDWTDSQGGTFPVVGYEVFLNGVLDKTVSSSAITMTNINALTIGSKTYQVKAIDSEGNRSGLSEPLVVTVAPPAAVTGFRATVIDNTVMFYWNDADTTLPVAHYELRKGGVDWATASVIGTKQGLFTTVNEVVSGDFVYRIAAVDVAGNVGDSVSVAAKVNQPPDYILMYDQFHEVSSLVANPSNAVKLDTTTDELLVNVNTSQTWEQHFTSNLLSGIEDFSVAQWNKINTTVVATALTNPAGGSTSSALTTTIVGNNYVMQTYNTTAHAGKQFTFSVWLKAGTQGGQVTLRLRDGVGAEIAIQTVTPTASWARYSVTGTFGASPAANIQVYIDPDNNAAAIGTTLFAWGAQLTAGGVVAPYWNSPNDQVNAGYPIYIQPQALTTTTLTKIVDYGALVANSRILTDIVYRVIQGTPTVSVQIFTSVDGTTYNSAGIGANLFASNFRYVKIVYTVSGGVISADKMHLLLDLKERTSGGSVNALASDVGGTRVGITGYIDISSIVTSVRGTTPLTVVVDFVDVANPTEFRVLAFNAAGTRVNAIVDYTLRGT